MPVSHLPSEGFTITLAAGVPLALTPAPYSNTKEIVFLNLSTTNQVLFRVGDPNSLVTPTLANATVLPPGASFSLCIGVEGTRQKLSNDPSPSLNYILISTGGAEVNVTYMQAQGNSVGC
jgi:hypothetical protein